jgi:hypothetical protein
MNTVLVQISLMIGMILFLLALIVAMINNMPLPTAFFRAIIALCGGAVVSAAFFRFFLGILYRFIDEKLKEQAQAKAQEAAKAANGSPVTGG